MRVQGETSAPSQVNFLGMSPPFSKPVLEIANAMWAAPGKLATDFTDSHGSNYLLCVILENPPNPWLLPYCVEMVKFTVMRASVSTG
jgi:hypothetical protein